MSDTARVIQLDQYSPPQDVVDTAVQTLFDGDLVVAPTETRYGILCVADDLLSVENLFRLKGRNAGAPSAVFVAGKPDMWKYLKVSPAARKLARTFLPGPLTLVGPATDLAKKTFGPEIVLNGRIGVRVSSSPLISALLEKVKRPLTATSANRSGGRELRRMSEIRDALSPGIGLYLDNGPLNGTASTVVLTGVTPITILREGAISAVRIKRTLAPMQSTEHGLRHH